MEARPVLFKTKKKH